MMKPIIPLPALHRLPLYYRELRSASARGILTMSSRQLGDLLGLPDTQVRKDLSYIMEEHGKKRVGYSTQNLADFLEEYLGLVRVKPAALVGVGNLARALMGYPEFEQFGLRIQYLFDIDPFIIGSTINAVEVLPVDALTQIVRDHNLCVGIITTPAAAAQSAADALVQGGICAIWNFAPINIAAPDSVYVVNEHLSTSFAVISHVLSLANKA